MRQRTTKASVGLSVGCCWIHLVRLTCHTRTIRDVKCGQRRAEESAHVERCTIAFHWPTMSHSAIVKTPIQQRHGPLNPVTFDRFHCRRNLLGNSVIGSGLGVSLPSAGDTSERRVSTRVGLRRHVTVGDAYAGTVDCQRVIGDSRYLTCKACWISNILYLWNIIWFEVSDLY